MFFLFLEEAMTIHHLCAFELAMFDQSEWCDMLEEDDLKVFEYLYDLKVKPEIFLVDIFILIFQFENCYCSFFIGFTLLHMPAFLQVQAL